jgi:membrane protease YdiL (CAAX protease family)
MRTLALIGLVAGVLAITALASPAIFALTQALGFHFSFGRTWNRVFEVLLVVAIVGGWRRLDLGAPAAVGFRRAHAVRDVAVGLLVGFAGIGVGLAFAGLFGGVVPALRFDPLKTVWKALAGLAGAILIGTGEEALFRGVLLRRLGADLGRGAGLVVMTAIYAVVHALRPGHEQAGHAAAGLERAVGLFAPLGDPQVWPAIAGLFAFGSVLALARVRSGALWLPIGIHAAWVATFRVGRLFVDIRRRPAWVMGPGWPPIVGGAAGGVAVAVTLLLLVVVLRRRRRGS